MGAAKMTNRLEALEEWATGLVGQLEPASRNKLARSVGQALRRSQQQRIIAQQNPDGSKYASRKRRDLRGKQGRVKQKVKMFQKLRTSRFLKVNGSGNAIIVGFKGRVARISRVHQFGLKDRPEKDATEVSYAKRELLGFTEADLDLIRDILITSLTQIKTHNE
jgi:phage virion morphogenesis protein